MNILSQVAKGMQENLTKTADIIARHTGFIKRLRKLSGSGFVQTLLFGWLSNPQATLEELFQTAATLGKTITPQGLDKRFTPEAASCLQKVLEASVSTAIADEPVAIPILRRFSGVYIQDSSTIILPDILAIIWPGCGGSSEKNTSSALKTQIQLDLNTGKLTGPYLQPGREHDQNSKIKDLPLPEGSLRITDLGFFSLEYFNPLEVPD